MIRERNQKTGKRIKKRIERTKGKIRKNLAIRKEMDPIFHYRMRKLTGTFMSITRVRDGMKMIEDIETGEEGIGIVINITEGVAMMIDDMIDMSKLIITKYSFKLTFISVLDTAVAHVQDQGLEGTHQLIRRNFLKLHVKMPFQC